MVDDDGFISIRRAPRTFRELHEKCVNCSHPYHDHFNPDDECWCGCRRFESKPTDYKKGFIMGL